MCNFRILCHSLKSVILRTPKKYKFHRKFCSQAINFKEVLKNSYVQKYFDQLQTKDVGGTNKSVIKFEISQLIEQRKEVLVGLQSLEELENSTSKVEQEFLKMLKEEKNEFKTQLSNIEIKLLNVLAPELPNSNEVIVEINAGVGGKEAMLFAGDLQNMYLSYIDFKNWSVLYQDNDFDDVGGLRHCSLFVQGKDVLNHLRHESGIHRVQRIPLTEKHGRIHTSTVSVAVLLQARDIDVNLVDKDLRIETMRASGAGGQHVNKTESAVRITHIPTGIVAECQTDRSQIKNREIARQKLCARLYEIQEREQIKSTQKSRKAQVGTSARSDKIRTYNFPQNRVTDHRINKTFHNLTGFLDGTENLDFLIRELISSSEKERIDLFVSSLCEQEISA